MRSGMFVFPAIEQIVYGQPAAQALRAEVERLSANRVFLMVSGTMNRTTDEIARVREMLGRIQTSARICVYLQLMILDFVTCS